MRLVILGAGGHGNAIYDAAFVNGNYDEIIFLDDHYGEDCKVISYGPTKTKCHLSGKCSDYKKFIDDNTEIYPAFGNNEVRLKWQKEIKNNGGKLPTIISKFAFVSRSAVICEGTVVLPEAFIGAGSYISNCCIINAASIIDHGCFIEEGVHINVGAVVMGENTVPRLSVIEADKIVKRRELYVGE